jgi:hypothetical protein
MGFGLADWIYRTYTLNSNCILLTDLINALPGNAAVNLHPQQWETVFSMGPMQMSYLKDEWCCKFSSEFSVEDSHRKFIAEEEKGVSL